MQSFAGMPADRLKRAIAAFVRELFPTLDYMGLYEYVVVAFDVTTQLADLQSNGDLGLPTPMTKVAMRTSLVLDLIIGTTVLVGFENRDPTKPYIAHPDKFSNAGFAPSFTGIAGALPTDAPPVGAALARVGDQVGPWIITTGSLKAKSR